MNLGIQLFVPPPTAKPRLKGNFELPHTRTVSSCKSLLHSESEENGDMTWFSNSNCMSDYVRGRRRNPSSKLHNSKLTFLSRTVSTCKDSKIVVSKTTESSSPTSHVINDVCSQGCWHYLIFTPSSLTTPQLHQRPCTGFSCQECPRMEPEELLRGASAVVLVCLSLGT